VPIDQPIDKPVPVKIIAPGVVNTYANKTISIPIILQNTWKEDIMGIGLSGIALNASFANEQNITITFSRPYINILPMGAKAESVLEISNYRKEGPFEVTIYARVTEPEFTDSTNILISSLEQTSRGEEVKSKVTFAKDMLSQNPECRELNDLLDRAEATMLSGDYEEAMKLVDGVINGCKYLMQNEQSRRETPSIIQKSFDFAREYSNEIMITAGAIFSLTIIFYTLVALRRKIMEK
jgi:hypothetical protein